MGSGLKRRSQKHAQSGRSSTCTRTVSLRGSIASTWTDATRLDVLKRGGAARWRRGTEEGGCAPGRKSKYAMHPEAKSTLTAGHDLLHICVLCKSRPPHMQYESDMPGLLSGNFLPVKLYNYGHAPCSPRQDQLQRQA